MFESLCKSFAVFFGAGEIDHASDAEHKDALSGAGPWAKSGGKEVRGNTHTFLRAASVEGSQGPGGLSFSLLIMTVW